MRGQIHELNHELGMVINNNIIIAKKKRKRNSIVKQTKGKGKTVRKRTE